MSRAGYRLLAHTADVGLAAWGPTLEAALAAALRGMTAVTYEPRTARPVEEWRVEVAGDDPERWLVGLLGEAIFLHEDQGFVLSDAEVTRTSGGVAARLRGEPRDPSRHHRRGPQVKAVTYHALRVDPGPPARIRAILDI